MTSRKSVPWRTPLSRRRGDSPNPSPTSQVTSSPPPDGGKGDSPQHGLSLRGVAGERDHSDEQWRASYAFEQAKLESEVQRLKAALEQERQRSMEERTQRSQLEELFKAELAAQTQNHNFDVERLETSVGNVLKENQRLSCLVEQLLGRVPTTQGGNGSATTGLVAGSTGGTPASAMKTEVSPYVGPPSQQLRATSPDRSMEHMLGSSLTPASPMKTTVPTYNGPPSQQLSATSPDRGMEHMLESSTKLVPLVENNIVSPPSWSRELGATEPICDRFLRESLTPVLPDADQSVRRLISGDANTVSRAAAAVAAPKQIGIPVSIPRTTRPGQPNDKYANVD